ncbi:2-octaprenyl-6-methoxyphenyl hydroxylase [Skermanella stibiiresistens SB22]|uniref:2-octaprenyl-6-methoxyphenyl hydroxylase n=1 Tax=Skermanella stibiiresistens SB22 TaxID=1385369 RepID=W9GPE4_9PROT|nr:UbiH/UbiF/VisC/COQ6 family ubiquinone biosynthesis hydroxylase [Skermanella stibiiresistens]EWY35750.1 2-octaprenyl-6-methoxyphenyl hydroxylase [Skermanella stibiiresistens SB22]
MTTSDESRPSAAGQSTDSAGLTTDVVIVGGGLAGLTLATALATAGVPVICLDRDTPPTQLETDFDGRTTALAFCSKQVLAGAGVWPHMAEDAEPILDIRVVDQESPLFLHYDHTDVGIGPFGWIADNTVIRRALFARVAELPNLRHIVPASVTRIERDSGGAKVTLADGRVVKARLVVGADGKNSFCRKSAGITVTTWTYDQSAMICNIAHDQPHGGVAVEKFLPGGPFAILPLTDNRSSIVWSEKKTLVPKYLDMSTEAFTAELQRRVGTWLGPIRVVTKRSAWPLSVLHADSYVAPRLALVGEAAHAMHPIAGQGLNMGLRDVAALAEVIVDAHRLGLDVGGPEPLARYQRWRRFDNLTLITVTDLLTRLFSNDFGPLKLARDLGMAAVNRMPPLKKFFMRHAMGMVGELPRMIRGEPL